MWIPHFGFYFWEPQGDVGATQASLSDREPRRFYITLYMDHPIILKVEDSQVEVREVIRKRIDHETGFIEVQFEPNDKGRLSQISCRLEAPTYAEAAQTVFNTITRQLSMWAFDYQAPQSIYAMFAYDELHSARWLCKPQHAAADPFLLPESVAFDPRFWAILSLFREGVNSRSPYYRFLCFYKVLEAYYEHRNIFRQADEIIRSKGLKLERPNRRVTQSMLVLSLLHAYPEFKEFEGRSFGWVFERLRSNARVRIAHIFPDLPDAGIMNLDDYFLYNEFASLSNVVSLMAHQIITDELMLWQNLLQTGAVEMPPPPPTAPKPPSS